MGCGASSTADAKEKRIGQWTDAGVNPRNTIYGRSNLPEELKTEHFALRSQAEAIFILADKDHDGRLDLNELRDIMHRPELAEMVRASVSYKPCSAVKPCVVAQSAAMREHFSLRCAAVRQWVTTLKDARTSG